uniref:Uncharacterized protein n=1 Tax=Tanacetum cinerariifolium TaxID=118510 RepID=A0A6L2JWH6_TANCI|nr:hypothetical protein [Tanacetum cinerariifolium]
MIELVMHTVKNDMVIHTEKFGMMILVVEIEYVGMIADVVDKVTCSFDGLQLEQVDRNHKFTPLWRNNVQELRVHLKLFQIHVVDIHIIKEQLKSQVEVMWEIMESKEIKVAKIGIKDNAADAFTKVVPGPKFKYCMKILGVGINYSSH